MSQYNTPNSSQRSKISQPETADYVHNLPRLSETFYTDLNRAVTPMIGYETGARNFGHALKYLNYHLNMQLDELDVEAFELLLTSLAQANRFGGDLHICPVLGENSAVHTLRTLILDTEITRRAGNLSNEYQLDPAAQRQHIKRLRAILTHDMGEIPGEMTSLAARTRNSSLQELPEIERDIFRIHLSEAYRTALSPAPIYPQFYTFQAAIRRAVSAAQVHDEHSQMRMAAQLKEIVSQYDSTNPTNTLPSNVVARITQWMSDFDTIELKEGDASRETLFIGYCAKITEHLQGTRHLLRFGTIHPEDRRLDLVFPKPHPSAPQDPLSQSDPKAMIPLRYLSNMRLIKAFRYMETELAGLFAHASTEHEFRHARALRDMVFLTQIEWLSIGRPICDRRILRENSELQVEDSFLVQLQDSIRRSTEMKERSTLMQIASSFLQHRLREDLDTARTYRASLKRTPTMDRLLDLETRGRMQALYLRAIQKDYIPSVETPLVLLEELPLQLYGFTHVQPRTPLQTPERS